MVLEGKGSRKLCHVAEVSEVEKKDFDVDIELVRVDDYALYGLVYHYILGERDLTL